MSNPRKIIPWVSQDIFYSSLGEEPIFFTVHRGFGWAKDHQEVEYVFSSVGVTRRDLLNLQISSPGHSLLSQGDVYIISIHVGDVIATSYFCQDEFKIHTFLSKLFLRISVKIILSNL